MESVNDSGIAFRTACN